MNNKNNLGNRIRSIRTKLGKSQEEFGKLFDPPAPKSAVSRWEHGGSPNKKRLAKIAELGGVTVDELVNGSLLDAINTLTSVLYKEYFEYLDYMANEGTTWKNYVASKASNSEGETNYTNMSQLFAYLEYDDFLKDSSKKNSDNYHRENLIAGFRYCANEVLKIATAERIKPTETGLLIRLFFEVEMKHFSNMKSDNEGLFNTAIDGLNQTVSSTHNLVYGLNQNLLRKGKFAEIEIPNTIDKKIYKEASKILLTARKQLIKLAEDNNIKIDKDIR
ncbi:helix-turn-helix domain-containing protein [Limosilactobacillus reuteri]|uniref:helix-turn-helix domain-containing protein n=1 Tax=Limosilactobacillus reuteri TaxID=1598 RepID=UPI00214AF719|nr:helix-turn-helix transcriptional regulator [Limosilactobacillus reuteri]MCR1878372.1 helix-turn-helix domain-containing protein [Limosilactobacillus reuteri]